MKLTKIIALTVLLAFSVVFLTACGNKLDGTWKNTEDGVSIVYEFDDGDVEAYFEFEDDNETIEIFKGEYKTKGNKIIMNVNDGGGDEEIECEYKISGDKLILKDESGEMTFKKAK